MEEQIQTQTVNEPPKKKSPLPIIIVVVILLVLVGVGGYLIGSNSNKEEVKEPETKTEEKKEEPKEKEPSEEPGEHEEETKDEDADEDAVATYTKNITLNGRSNVLKVNVTLSDDFQGVKSYSQTVYFNGNKVLEKIAIPYPAPVLSKELNNYYKDAVDAEFNNTKTIKDVSNSEEYVVFTDNTDNVHYGIVYWYVIDSNGNLITKVLNKIGGSGILIYTDNDSRPDIFTNNTDTEDNYKYVLDKDSVVNKDSIIYADSFTDSKGNNTKLSDTGFPCEFDNYSLIYKKLTISNGKATTNNYAAFKPSDGYEMGSVGGCAW